MARTLFEKYGGFSSVSRIVMTFYEKALDSDQIGEFFETIDMPQLIDHQTKFVASLMGGPAAFSDERLRAVHASLKISHADFDEMGALLSSALAEHGVDPADIDAVVAEIEARRAIIVAPAAA